MKGAVSSPRTFNVNPSSAWNLAQVFMSLRIYMVVRKVFMIQSKLLAARL